MPKNASAFATLPLIFVVIILGLILAGFLLIKAGRNADLSQRVGKPVPKKIGVIQHVKTLDPVYQGFKEGMSKLGYTEGDNVLFEYIDDGGDISKVRGITRDFINKKVDLILVITTQALEQTLKESTASGNAAVPIVFTNGSTAIQQGLVKSFKSSGNNSTGIIPDDTKVSAKKLDFLKDINPGAKKVLIFTSPGAVAGEISAQSAREGAKKLGITIVEYKFKNKPGPLSTQELKDYISTLKPGDIDAIMTMPEPVVNSAPENLKMLLDLSKRLKVPTFFVNLGQGGLIGYNLDLTDSGKQAAEMADKILKGAKPADIPLGYSRKNYLEVNLKLAKELGITIPDSIIAIADRKIE
ncbi:ABC transporter substrate-binding protein [Candidatus Daviesbacteria bacterium]|nr:ABC transporter substrate-binding protein [Candidatus Daviesbacteria bacterium]